MPDQPVRTSNDATFPATGFRANYGNRSENGQLTVSYGGLRFETESGALELPWKGLQIEAGDHNRGQLFFHHPTHPGLSISVADFHILEHGGFREDPLVRAQLEAFRKPRRKWSRFVLFLAVILLLLGGATAVLFWMGFFKNLTGH